MNVSVSEKFNFESVKSLNGMNVPIRLTQKLNYKITHLKLCD